MPAARHSGLFYFVGACAVGALLRSFVEVGLTFSLLILLLAAALALILALQPSPATFLLVCILGGGALGLLRMEWSARQGPDEALLSLVSREVVAVGVVDAEPDVRDRTQLVALRAETVDGMPAQTSGILITSDAHLPIRYGDRLAVRGTLKLPENFETDSGRIFNYVEYLAKERVYFRMFDPKVEVVERGRGNPLFHRLFEVKNYFLEELTQVLPEPEVSLLGGLLVGAKQSLGEELLSVFRATGLIHIVVLSGYNLSLIAEGLRQALRSLPLVWGNVLGGAAIVLFTLMVGASAATVRASIMALLILLARSTGRVYDITRALAAAAFLMIMHDPRIVAFDPGFQLSFIATLGLIHLAPLLEARLIFVTRRFALRALL